MALKVVPRKTPDYYVKQPKSENLPRLPGAHFLLLGPSKSGKSTCWQSMLLDGYKDCFSRIFLFTPSGLVDDSLKPIKEYIEKTLKHNVEKEGPYIMEDLDPTYMKSILKKQEKIHDMLKNKVYADKNYKGQKWLPNILIIISDHADNPKQVHRAGSVLETLMVRSRHFGVSCWVDSQCLKLIAPSSRLNITGMVIFRLRSSHDLQGFIDEYSALGIDKKMLSEIYRTATKAKYSFLFVNMLADSIDNMFFKCFDTKLVPVQKELNLEA